MILITGPQARDLLETYTQMCPLLRVIQQYAGLISVAVY